MKLLFVLALLQLQIIAGVQISSLQNQTITKIAFGSCSRLVKTYSCKKIRHDKDQPVWKGVEKFKPDFWVWLGDIVYADTMVFPFYWVFSSLWRNY